MSVDEAWGGGFVRRAVSCMRDDRVFADRGTGDLVPLFPFVWALGLMIGVQQRFPAERTSAVLRLQQT
jgi:hypothetical protein